MGDSEYIKDSAVFRRERPEGCQETRKTERRCVRDRSDCRGQPLSTGSAGAEEGASLQVLAFSMLPG